MVVSLGGSRHCFLNGGVEGVCGEGWGLPLVVCPMLSPLGPRVTPMILSGGGKGRRIRLLQTTLRPRTVPFPRPAAELLQPESRPCWGVPVPVRALRHAVRPSCPKTLPLAWCLPCWPIWELRPAQPRRRLCKDTRGKRGQRVTRGEPDRAADSAPVLRGLVFVLTA